MRAWFSALWAYVRSLSGRETAMSSGALFASRMIGMFTGFVTSPLVTRMLGASGYGSLSFTINIVIWISILFSLGIDSAPRVAAVTESQEEQRQLVGAYMLIFIGWGALMSAFVWGIHGLVDSFFSVPTGDLLGVAAPLIVFVPIGMLNEWMLRGLGRIRMLGMSGVAAAVLYMIGVLWLSGKGNVTPEMIIRVRYISYAAVQVVVLAFLRPSFSGLRHQAQRIWREFVAFGWHAFSGRVPSVLSSEGGKLVLGYFVTAELMGYYNIAATLSAPVQIVGTSYSQALYRKMASMAHLARQQQMISAILCIVSAVGAFVVGTGLIYWLYPPDFEQAIPLLGILCLGSAAKGAYSLYTQFLSSHGAGRVIRRACIIGAIGGLSVSVVLTTLFSVYGAAAAVVLASSLNLWLYARGYYSITRVPMGRRTLDD